MEPALRGNGLGPAVKKKII